MIAPDESTIASPRGRLEASGGAGPGASRTTRTTGERADGVLVVDDDPDFRDVLRTVLTADGFDVSVAVDGVDAMDVLRREMPAVILLDVRMPRMDGITFARERRRRPSLSLLPIIVVSCCEEEDVRREIDVDAFIPKPADLETLRRAVRDAIEREQARRRRS